MRNQNASIATGGIMDDRVEARISKLEVKVENTEKESAGLDAAIAGVHAELNLVREEHRQDSEKMREHVAHSIHQLRSEVNPPRYTQVQPPSPDVEKFR
jgi:uncharacterized coiled-coil protein SlyX